MTDGGVRVAPGPPRAMGTGSATALVIANMIGVGVFTTSGFALADLRSPALVLLAWAVGGGIALCGALSYAALVTRMPESGGEYLFLSRAVHPVAGFLAGWVSLLAGFTAPIAAAALGLQAYMADSFGVQVDPHWLGTAAIAGAALLHAGGVAPGLRAQNVAVVAKVALIAGFIVLGAALMAPAEAAAPRVAPGVDAGAFAVTLVWISFSYSGWNAAVYLAGESSQGAAGLRRALLLGTGLTTLIYLALNAVFVYSAPVEVLAGRADIGAVAAESLGGLALRRFVSGIVALALLTSISSMVVAGPRVYAKMAEDGVFPSVFLARGGAPRAAVLLQGAIAIAVLWMSSLAELLSFVGFTLGLSAAVTVATLFWIRRADAGAREPMPGYPLAPAVFILATLTAAVFMAQRQRSEAAVGLALVLLGLPLYALSRRLGGAARGLRLPPPDDRGQGREEEGKDGVSEGT